MRDETWSATDDGLLEEPGEPETEFSGWIDTNNQQPAEMSIIEYLCDEDWKKEKNRGGERQPCQAVLIRDAKSKQTLFSWTGKQDSHTCEQAVSDFLEDVLVDDPEPRTERWLISRSPMPDMRDFDSSRVVVLASPSWSEPAQAETETGLLRAPVPSLREGVPPIMRGPAPTSHGPVPPIQLSGDIGGTGIADVSRTLADVVTRLMSVATTALEFANELNMRTVSWAADNAVKSGDSSIRSLELQTDLEKRRMELETEGKASMTREVGGVMGSLAGQVVSTPVGQRFLERIMGSEDGRKAVIGLMSKFAGTEEVSE